MVQLNLSIRCSTGTNFDVSTSDSVSVLEFKQVLASAELSNIPVEQQRLIYKGRVLKDELTLESYDVESGQAVHLVKSASAPPQPTPSTLAQQQQQSGAGGGLGALAGMMGSQGGAGAGGAAAGMEGMLQQNPEMMSAIMDSPMFQNMLNNPEMLRQMVESNPQTRQLLENNPELRHVLQDPAVIRQSMEAARNPAVMQEMMRNRDRAMANIESLPGGYNALTRMYRDVEEPMMAAAERGASGEQSNSTATTSNAPATTEPTSTPMPNPWGAPVAPPASQNMQQGPGQLGGMFESMFGGAGAGAGGGGMGGLDMNALSQMMGLGAGIQAPPPPAPLAPRRPNPWANLGSGADNANRGAASATTNDANTVQQADAQALLQQQQRISGAMQGLMGGPQLGGGQGMQGLQSMLASMGGNAAGGAGTGAAGGGGGSIHEMAQRMMQQNPEMVRQMQQQIASNPQMLASLMGSMGGANGTQPGGTGTAAPPVDFQQLMQGMMQGMSGSAAGTADGAAAGARAGGLAGMMAALSGQQSGGARTGMSMPGGVGGVPQQPRQHVSGPPPEQRYAVQLSALESMGFTDRAANVRALSATHGNINAAVERLIGGM